MKLCARLACYLQAFESFEKAMQVIDEQGFKAINVHSEEITEEMKKPLKESGKELSMHTFMIDTNLASTNEGIRKESIRQLRAEIDLCSEIGCMYITVHGGKSRNKFHEEEAYQQLTKTFDEVIPYAMSKNVQISLEYLEDQHRFIGYNAETMEYFLERYPTLLMTLDFAHAAINQADPIALFRKFKNRIKIVHLSGHHPQRSHVEVSLSESVVDPAEFIREILKYDVLIEIENRLYEKFQESYNYIMNVG